MSLLQTFQLTNYTPYAPSGLTARGSAMKTMKQTIIILASALAFFTGCVSKDMYGHQEGGEEISFSTPVVGAMTKSSNPSEVPHYGEIDTTYPTDEFFTVFAVQHVSPSNYDGWSTANATYYINGVAFAYDTRYNGWSGSSTLKPEADRKAYPWPMGSVLSFGCYSPTNAHSATPGNGTGTFVYAADGLSVTDFSVHSDASLQQDLMYAERIYNKTSNNNTPGGYNGLDLTFNHMLSSIRFTVKQDREYTGMDITLTSIELGKVQYKGSFKENIDQDLDATATYKSAAEWTEVSPELTATGYQAYSGETLLSTESQELSGALLLMPQLINDYDKLSNLHTNIEAYITVVYQVALSGHTYEQSATVRLSDLTKRWEMGKRYIYNISIGYDTITFSPTVSEWENVSIESVVTQ